MFFIGPPAWPIPAWVPRSPRKVAKGNNRRRTWSFQS